MTPTTALKVAAALAVAAHFRIACLTAAVLFAHNSNSNPVLLGCLLYWRRRALQLLDRLVETRLAPVWGALAAAASAYLGHLGHADPEAVRRDAPHLVRVCADLVMSNEDLVAYYRGRARAPPPPVPRLCPNGDHGAVEETLIILREHARRIAGAVLTAVFLSALATYLLQAAQGLYSKSTTSIKTVETVETLSTFDADFDCAATYGTPRTIYRAPPADPGAVVLYREDAAAAGVLEDGRPSVAAMRAARAARAAGVQQAAADYVAAVRRRIEQDNADADRGFTGGGMSLFGLEAA